MFVYNVCLCFGMRISQGSLENWGDISHRECSDAYPAYWAADSSLFVARSPSHTLSHSPGNNPFSHSPHPTCASVCKEDGTGEGKKMAQGKIARRLASARLNAVRCGSGKTPFSHHALITFLRRTGLDIVRDIRDRLAKGDPEDDDLDVGLIGRLSMDLDI